MAKTSSKKSLKSLFSRSEANLRETTARDVDKNDGEKKRFKLFRFKRKSNSGSPSDKPANENQQVLLSPADATRENGAAWAENNMADKNKASLYATAPRSKGKELSYSEMDLRKPKKFATFSFGLRKRKKKEQEGLSKSVFGLQSTGIEEQEEPSDLTQMEIDQTTAKTMSMSQPELDTSTSFDIPSPPPVATNQSDLHFTLSAPSLSTNAQPESKQPLINGSNFLDIHAEPLRAPIATIPELQLDGPDLPEEKGNIPAQGNSARIDAGLPALTTQAEANLKQNELPLGLDAGEVKAAALELVPASNGLSDTDSLQHTKTEISLGSSTKAALPTHQMGAPDVTDGTTLNTMPSLASVVSSIDTTATKTTPDLSTAVASSINQDSSMSHTQTSIPETTKSATPTPADTTPVNQTEVYGALYESLFPQSFTSEVMSSLLNSPPQVHTEIRHLNESYTERSIIYSTVTSSLSSSTESAETNTVPYSELTRPLSEVKSDSSGLIQSTISPALMAQSPAPPVSDYVTSLETDTQVTDPKRRVILVKESVADEMSSDPGCSSPGPEKMDIGRELELKMDTEKTFSGVLARKMSGYDGALSPTYFSVGSDDGSAIEIYYSAEEDNLQDSGDEEIFTVAKEEESRIADRDREAVEVLGELPKENAETEINKKDEGGTRVLIVKMQNEGSSDEKNGDIHSQTEVYHRSSETWTSEGSNAKTYEKEVVTTVIPEVVRLSQEISKQEEIGESKTDEGGLKVVIVKVQNEGSNDEPSQTDVHQQSSGTITSEILERHNAKSQEEEVLITTLPRVKEAVVLCEELMKQEIEEKDLSQADEGARKVIIVKVQNEAGDGEDTEVISRKTEGYLQSSESWTTRVLEGNDFKNKETEVATTEVQEVKELREYIGDISKMGEVPESETSLTDEGGHRVVIVKIQNEGSDDGKIEDISSQTEVVQLISSQSSETLRTESPEANAKVQESDEVFSKAAGEVKEVVKLLEDISYQKEITEQEIEKRDDGKRVVIVRMENKGVNDEKKEVQPYLGHQNLEILTTGSPEGIDTKIEKEEEAATEMAEGVKEVFELLENFPKQDEIAEEEISNKEEGGVRVVIVRMSSDEKIEDVGNQSEEQPQLRGHNPVTETSQNLERNYEISQEAEVALPIVEEGIKDLKEVLGLHEELPKKEIGEQEMKQDYVEDKKEDISSRTEVQPHYKVSETLFLERKDAKILEEDVATKACPEVAGEVKEVIRLIEEVSKNEETAEKETSKINIGGEEEIRSRVEVQTWTSRALGHSNEKNQGENISTKASPEVAGEVIEVVKVIEEVSNNVETAEKETSKRDIGGKEEIRSRVEVQTWTSRTLGHSNEKNQEENISTKASPEVAGEVIEVVKVIEEVSNNGETAEKETSKGHVDDIRRIEVQTWTSRTLEKNNREKNQEEVTGTSAFPKVAEEVKEAIKGIEDISNNGEFAEKEKEDNCSQIGLNQPGLNTQISKFPQDDEVKCLHKDAATTAFPEVMKEVKEAAMLLEDSSKDVQIAEKEIRLKDEDRTSQREQEISSQSEVQQRVKSSGPLTSGLFEAKDAKTQVEEKATAALSQVKEGGQEERKEEGLATPVGQVKTLMVCDLAPPSCQPHELGEGSEANQTKELGTEDHPKEDQQLPGQEVQCLADKAISSPEYIHAASGNSSTVEERITPLFREAEKQVSLLAEANKTVKVSTETDRSPTSAVTGTSGVVEVVTNSAELQSDATQIEHNRAPQRKTEWADTVTEKTDRTRTVQEQVAVVLSDLIEDTQLPDTNAAETHLEKKEQPAEPKPDLNDGSLTVSRVPTVTSDILTSENPATEVVQDSDDTMNSAYSSLSTTLSFRTSSPPKEDELKYRFHKVSLISDSDGKESSQDAADSIKSSSTVIESNGADVESEYRWKNRFEGVSQYKPSTTDESSYSYSRSYTDSYSSPSSLSYTSTLPEATAYKHVSNALSSSSSFYTPSSEEQITFSSRLSDRSEVYLSRESEPAGERTDEWRRGLTDREEPAAPAGEREREGESESFKSRWESHQSPVSRSLSSEETSYDRTDSFKEEDDDSARFTGVFKATLVELVPEPTPPPPTTPPASPDIDSPNQFDMDNLVDTLKNMGPSMRPRGIGPRPPAPVLISSLPPIVEDAPSPVSTDVCDSGSLLKKMEAASKPAESLNGLYTLPADLGLKRNAARDTRPPLELMKQGQQEQLLNSPLRASATNSIVMRRSSDSSPEDLQSPLLNGNTGHSGTTSRLDSSVIFGSYRSGSIDQKQENRQAHRPLFRTSSLPETGLSNDRVASKDFSNLSTGSSGADQTGSRFERFSFLLNSTPSSSGSLTGAEDPNMRMSQPPSMGINSPTSSKSSSPSRILSPTGSIDLQRSFNMDPPLSMFGQNQGIGMGMGMGVGTSPLLQRSFSNEGTTGVQQTSLFSSGYGGSQFQSQEQEKNLVPKYRAFPDAYLTKEKEHGKLNPRPGKMYVFDRPGWCGQRVELRGDVMDATSWELQETISIRVVRGGWVLYEKPNFKGEKIALDEGDIELTYPFGPPEEQLQNGQQEGQKQNGEENGETSDVQTENKPARRFIIGSLRRAVRDYSVPEISLFPEENAEGKKVIFRDTSDDARIYGLPIKANSIIINAGLWLVYAHPFFQGVPRILEVGGYTNPAAWGVEKPYVGSLHPLKVGEPRVENLSEPKIVIYEKPYFTGKSRTITTNMRDFMTRVDRQQTAFMYSVASMKVLGGIWVGYEKEGFRGHQYLLEEGEYQDWRVWGGCDAELRSVRVIRADFTEPSMIMFEQPEEDQEGMQEENTFEVTEAIPDVELFEYKTSTRSIHVLSGAWVGYSHVDFSGNQYILEKGFYNNCADWGSQDNRICSVQPILLAPSDGNRDRNEVILYSEPGFQGECHVFHQNQETLPDRFFAKSCRVSGGSWVFYDDKKFSGNLYVLSEGDYPSLASMGCPSDSKLRSVKAVPMSFSIPSISLFGLECLEGREITMDTEIISLVEEGFNNHILSVRVNSGCWVICEHSNYRGRQFLLEPIEITYWPKFSSLQTIGSMYPVRQKHQLFRIKNKERDHFLSIQGGVEEMKSGRVVVTPEVEGLSDVWFYQDGLIKSKVSPTMSLQVVGNVEPAAKVSLWSETRQPIQTWTFKMTGLITSLTSPGMVLDVKGGKAYDKDHVVIMTESEERPSQQWEIELL